MGAAAAGHRAGRDLRRLRDHSSRPRRSAALYAFVHPVLRAPAICQVRRDVTACAGCDGASLVGGVLVILGAAMGLTQLHGRTPRSRRSWSSGRRMHIHSPLVFLLRTQPLPARRRLPDGHLLGDRGGGAADHARSGRRSGINPVHLGHHLRRQPRARLPDAAGRAQPVPRVLPASAPAAARGCAPRRSPMLASSQFGVLRHHLRAVADDQAIWD